MIDVEKGVGGGIKGGNGGIPFYSYMVIALLKHTSVDFKLIMCNRYG